MIFNKFVQYQKKIEMSRFKEFFSFNKTERRGVFVLLFLIMLLLLYRIFGPFSVSRIIDQSDYEYQIVQFLNTKETEKPKQESFTQPSTEQTTKKHGLRPHPFDPNTMTKKQWISMGLSKRQAQTIEKYKSKGGKFREAEDLKKIYCISEAEYEKLSPYVIINLPEEKEQDYSEPVLNIDLNTVSMDEIQCVRGIGPSFAKRIVKYRQLLGGYIDINQLMEVYGMDSARFLAIKPYFSLSLDSVKRIPINTADFTQLHRHPYISDQLAYEIGHYRNIHGRFSSIEELKKINLVTDSIYQKIYLYFATELK